MWIETFKLGLAGREKDFAQNPSELTWHDEEISVVERNLKGKKSKIVKRVYPVITLTIPYADITELNFLNSMKNDRSDFKKLLVNDEFKIVDEVRISETKSIVYLNDSPRADITILGVWLFDDIEHAGTNYYIGGAFIESEGRLTLGVQLPSASTKVLINYLYKGWTVDITNVTPSFTSENPLTTSVSVEMEGV